MLFFAGNETRLSDCIHEGFGNVKQCDDRGHYAGVICFDETGMLRFCSVLNLKIDQWHSCIL